MLGDDFVGYIRYNKDLPNNIWNKKDFDMCGLGEKNRFIAKIKYFKRCIRWSKQRIVRGYADVDCWNMFRYLQMLIPDMLQDLRDHRTGSPGYLGKNYMNAEGILVNDTCHEEWNEILDKMIFLWKESREEACSRKNPHEEEYHTTIAEFYKKYGILGEKLQTEAELEENKKRGGGGTVHFMNELPEYKDIYEKYWAVERKLEEYREKCKDEALDMMKEYFYLLWD